MTLTGWILFLIVIQVLHAACTWKMYVAAGRKAWEATIPIYNAVVLMKIIKGIIDELFESFLTCGEVGKGWTRGLITVD